MTAPHSAPPVVVETTAAKAWVAGVGSTLTAAMTAVTAIATFTGDDAIDVNEVGGIITTLLTFGLAVWGVWQTENKPK